MRSIVSCRDLVISSRVAMWCLILCVCWLDERSRLLNVKRRVSPHSSFQPGLPAPLNVGCVRIRRGRFHIDPVAKLVRVCKPEARVSALVGADPSSTANPNWPTPSSRGGACPERSVGSARHFNGPQSVLLQTRRIGQISRLCLTWLRVALACPYHLGRGRPCGGPGLSTSNWSVIDRPPSVFGYAQNAPAVRNVHLRQHE
jgi:hypothetical protein